MSIQTARGGKYILDKDGNPVAEPDLIKWGKWMQETKSRVIQRDRVNGVFFSTVFLGLDQSFYDEEKHPILFETMAFREGNSPQYKEYDEFQRRYSTKREALDGHNELLNKLFTKEEIALSRMKK